MLPADLGRLSPTGRVSLLFSATSCDRADSTTSASAAYSATVTDGGYPAAIRTLHAQRFVRWAPWLLIAAGVLLRLQRYADNRSFWLDESLLGLNLIEKSTRGLLESLGYVQSAPQGFLLVEKGAMTILGDSEWSLRLFPFVASLAGIVLFALVVRRLLPPWPALLAMTLFVVNEPLLYQSSEAKPYSVDVTVALLITWLALRALSVPAGTTSVLTLAPLAAAGAGAVWFSYPSVFVLAGAFVALMLREDWSRRRRSLVIVLATAVLCAGSFLVLYALSAGTIATVRSSVFPGDDPHATSQVTSILRAGWASLADPGGFLPSMRGVAVLCLATGMVALLRSRRPERVALLIGPGALSFVAALLSKYPAGGRFWLFLVPSLLVLISLGAHQLVSASRRPVLLGLPLVLALAGPPVAQALAHVGNTPKREQVRPLLQQLVREWRSGDTLYVYPNAQYALRFYGECRDCGVARYPFPLRPAPPGASDRLGFPTALASSPPAVVIGEAGDTRVQALRRFDALRGRSRVWLLFSHVQGSDGGLDEQELSLTYLDKIGRRLGSRSEPGAALFLYDLRR